MERNISELETQKAGATAVTIEEYPDDKCGPTRRCWGSPELGDLWVYRSQRFRLLSRDGVIR